MSVADHFSRGSADYARFRPRYPEDLGARLAALAPGRRLAWDCATGSGQAAEILAPHFPRILATDASPAQLRAATRLPGVHYAAAPAEAAPLPDGAVDLVTAAQALHWFDRPRFFAEARRVLGPGGIVAVWTYARPRLAGDLDAALVHLHDAVVGPYWPGERRIVEDGYGTIAFPFDELPQPPAELALPVTLDGLCGYVGTWSATRRYRDGTGRDPVAPFRAAIAEAWGDPQVTRVLRWRFVVRVGRR